MRANNNVITGMHFARFALPVRVNTAENHGKSDYSYHRRVRERWTRGRGEEGGRFRVPDGFSKPTPHLRRNYNITRALCAKRNLLQPVYTRKTQVSDVDRSRGYWRRVKSGRLDYLARLGRPWFVYFDPFAIRYRTIIRIFRNFRISVDWNF